MPSFKPISTKKKIINLYLVNCSIDNIRKAVGKTEEYINDVIKEYLKNKNK